MPRIVQPKGNPVDLSARVGDKIDVEAVSRNRVPVFLGELHRIPKAETSQAIERFVGADFCEYFFDGLMNLCHLVPHHPNTEINRPIFPAFVTGWHIGTLDELDSISGGRIGARQASLQDCSMHGSM